MAEAAYHLEVALCPREEGVLPFPLEEEDHHGNHEVAEAYWEGGIQGDQVETEVVVAACLVEVAFLVASWVGAGFPMAGEDLDQLAFVEVEDLGFDAVVAAFEVDPHILEEVAGPASPGPVVEEGA